MGWSEDSIDLLYARNYINKRYDFTRYWGIFSRSCHDKLTKNHPMTQLIVSEDTFFPQNWKAQKSANFYSEPLDGHNGHEIATKHCYTMVIGKRLEIAGLLSTIIYRYLPAKHRNQHFY